MRVIIESHSFEIVAVNYLKKVAQTEVIGMLTKKIRKQSKKIAEAIVENMEIRVILKNGYGGGGGSLATATKIRDNVGSVEIKP
jgi:nanoRNase/pAp phosphatase (c-di-AMP/oligoRNAs hydrolase)